MPERSKGYSSAPEPPAVSHDAIARQLEADKQAATEDLWHTIEDHPDDPERIERAIVRYGQLSWDQYELLGNPRMSKGPAGTSVDNWVMFARHDLDWFMVHHPDSAVTLRQTDFYNDERQEELKRLINQYGSEQDIVPAA